MKAKWNNRGYSLVELMLTLAIFGLVMIGVGLIMRTTSASYVSGNSEVALQTEVQIVANQVEELLVDSTSVPTTGSITDGENTYEAFYIHDGMKNIIVYKDDTDELYFGRFYESDTSIDFVDFSLMAEYVTDFNITGVSVTETSDDCDNKVVIELAMNNDEHLYEVERDVFFRNAVENHKVYELADAGAGGGAEEEEDAYAARICAYRYGVVNLARDYHFDVTKPITTSSNFSTYFKFVDVTESSNAGANIYKAYTSVGALPEGKTTSVYVMINDTYTASYDTSLSQTSNVWVQGTNMKGETVKVLLYFDQVRFSMAGTGTNPATGPFKTAEGALYLGTTTGSGSGYTWIDINGIDITSMLWLGEQTYKYSVIMYVDANNNQKFDSANDTTYKVCASAATMGAAGIVPHGTTPTWISLKSDPCKLDEQLAFLPDPDGNGFLIAQDNTAYNGSNSDSAIHTALTSGTLRLAVMIHLPGDATDSNHWVADMNILLPGTAMTSYHGGNAYQVKPGTNGWPSMG